MIVTPYNRPPNLSPKMCMKKPYMSLTCLILGPSNPKASINVYLEPLIDDFNKLWSGIWIYDISKSLYLPTYIREFDDEPFFGNLDFSTYQNKSKERKVSQYINVIVPKTTFTKYGFPFFKM